MNQFFYDGQIRRFLTQFIRAISGYQVEFTNRNGGVALKRVPVIYGDSSRNVAQIINNNSPSTTPYVPVMAVYISDLKYARDRVQDPTYIGKLHLREREFDPLTGTYTTQQSDIMTVERLMPVPYTLSLKVDIWTSNTEQKLQLVEQISSLFNPALEIQSTDNYIDWTSLTAIFLTDINYSSRTIPIGTENPIDITTLTFELPIWISPPAKVKRMGVIQKIIASIYDDDGNINQAAFDDTSLLSRQHMQPLDYGIILLNNTISFVKYSDPINDTFEPQTFKTVQENITDGLEIVLNNSRGLTIGMQVGRVDGLNITTPTYITKITNNVITISEKITVVASDKLAFGVVTTNFGNPVNCLDVINMYGSLGNGITQIRIELPTGAELIGTVAYHPTDETLLLFSVLEDTKPTNTLDPVDAIIDPDRSRPGLDLPTPVAGTRYLILNDYVTADGAQPEFNWNGADNTPLVAHANDIIEYNGQHWAVSFDSSAVNTPQYVTNLTTTVQYRWTGTEWVKSYEGFYRGGQWSLVL